MTSLRLALFTCMLMLSVLAYPAEATFPCKPADEMMKSTFEDGYAWLAQSVSSSGYVIQVYIKESGQFRIIGIDNKISACILVEGDDWRFVLSKGA